MRPVVFVKYYEKGSTLMGGDQIAAAFVERGLEARSVPVAEIARERDAVLVFIKTSKLPDLWAARRRGNLLVLDVQDTICFKRWIKNRRLYHGLIFKNRRSLEDFGDSKRLGGVIYHQSDPRYRPHQAGEDELRVVYLGLRRSLPLYGEIPGVAFFDGDYFARALEYNCHLSLRDEPREFAYKPGTKVSTAAACGAVLITTPDASALEMLGEDYPFYTEPDRDAVLATIERTRAALGGPLWQAALTALERVRRQTSIESIVDDYVRYFADLERRSAVQIRRVSRPNPNEEGS